MQGPGKSHTFKAGEVAPSTGIYLARHKRHTGDQDRIIRANQLFPCCEVCGDSVKYELIRTAPYIFEDADFTERRKKPRPQAQPSEPRTARAN